MFFCLSIFCFSDLSKGDVKMRKPGASSHNQFLEGFYGRGYRDIYDCVNLGGGVEAPKHEVLTEMQRLYTLHKSRGESAEGVYEKAKENVRRGVLRSNPGSKRSSDRWVNPLYK
jgi:hypothetical protein